MAGRKLALLTALLVLAPACGPPYHQENGKSLESLLFEHQGRAVGYHGNNSLMVQLPEGNLYRCRRMDPGGHGLPLWHCRELRYSWEQTAGNQERTK